MKENDESIVKYSVLNESEQIFASKYKTVLPLEKELSAELERNRRFLEELKPSTQNSWPTATN